MSSPSSTSSIKYQRHPPQYHQQCPAQVRHNHRPTQAPEQQALCRPHTVGDTHYQRKKGAPAKQLKDPHSIVL